MKIKVYTRSMNLEYYELMRSLIPADIECERCTQFDQWYHAKDYVHYILQSDADFVINVDEDCFIYDWFIIGTIIDEMYLGSYTHFGMPDRHLSSHRFNLYTVQNPFFNIFNMVEIRKFYTGAYQTTEDQNIEPYNSVFLELAFFGKPLYNTAAHDHADGITTDTGFALHCWWSREPSHRDRILARYNDAVTIKQSMI